MAEDEKNTALITAEAEKEYRARYGNNYFGIDQLDLIRQFSKIGLNWREIGVLLRINKEKLKRLRKKHPEIDEYREMGIAEGKCATFQGMHDLGRLGDFRALAWSARVLYGVEDKASGAAEKETTENLSLGEICRQREEIAGMVQRAAERVKARLDLGTNPCSKEDSNSTEDS